jgi:hypothetical protein
MTKFNVAQVAAKFEQTYHLPGSGIKSVRGGRTGITVVVDSVEAAGKLPAKFGGISVHVVQDLGPAGEKAIIRDAYGKVDGAQG